MTGKVYLVGAGPGDPELLTVKALGILENADAVLHDELVSDEILRLIPSRAMLVNVGKRVGVKKITQEEINTQLITLVRSGLRVVRLKGGDPLIFGRAGEEMAALRQANVEFEIVPGITAALGAAAAAQIPLTHRKAAHALVLVTGHTTAGLDESNWPALVALNATLVVYMPGSYQHLSTRLVSSGLDPKTMCAVISRASTPYGQTYRTTVEGLADAPVLPQPALLVIGDAVVLDEQASLPIPHGIWNVVPDRATPISIQSQTALPQPTDPLGQESMR